MGFLNMFFSAIVMILLISLLILIHELGHFLAARAVGIRVDKFGFGLPIGPTLFAKKVGDTQILIHAFLLGGYVSFPDDEEDCDLPKDSPLRYSNKTVGQRAIVISAGVIFNVILAYILIFFTGLIWKHLPSNTFTVKFDKFADNAVVSLKNSGITGGDIIYSINSVKIDYPIAVGRYTYLSREFDDLVSEDIVKSKLEQLKELNPEFSENEDITAGTTIKIPEFTDEAPIVLTFDNIIGLEKYKSDEIALNVFQKQLRNDINYKTEYKLNTNATLKDIAYAISDTKKPLSIVVLRNGNQIALSPVYSSKEGILGFYQAYEENYVRTDSLKSLVKETFNYVNYNVKFMIYTLGKLFSGKVPVSEMNGIVAITKIGTELIAYKGIFQGILLAAMISLNLALLNILPIPALDGGHLFFLIVEKIIGRPVSKKFLEIVGNIFFYLLIILMLFILYNDIHAWIIGKI